MIKPYLIRVEYPNHTHIDIVVEAPTIKGAKSWFESEDDKGELAPYDWRGQVVFVQGARPAEEIRFSWEGR